MTTVFSPNCCQQHFSPRLEQLDQLTGCPGRIPKGLLSLLISAQGVLVASLLRKSYPVSAACYFFLFDCLFICLFFKKGLPDEWILSITA